MTALYPDGPFFGEVPRVERLPADIFRTHYDAIGLPVVITGSIAHWPALEKWSHEWFKTAHGAVQVELSVNPTHTKKVVKKRLGEYIDLILANRQMGGGLYLDQYPMGNIPALQRDVEMPAYCPQDRQVVTNLWLGPSTTVLSFHKDNHWSFDGINNIFVQIRGRKRIVLAAPDQDEFMYPRPPDAGAYWHSSVDLKNIDLERFPLFRRATLLEAIVEPGDVIFIPRYYWHYVEALEKSISLSFWWRPSRFAERLLELIQQAEAVSSHQGAHAGIPIPRRELEEFGGRDALDAALLELDPVVARKVAGYVNNLLVS